MSERLKWIFAALFLACGAALLFLEARKPDPWAERLLAGAATLSLGAFVLCLAWNAWETGAVKLQQYSCTRGAQPLQFAAVLALVLAAGIGTLTTAVWFLFFK